MKKLISLSLALILTLSLGVLLVSCDEHVCEFKEEWTADETHHWHECLGENCLETDGKAEHTWDEGTINDETATETTADLTYTCTVWGREKEETIGKTEGHMFRETFQWC